MMNNKTMVRVELKDNSTMIFKDGSWQRVTADPWDEFKMISNEDAQWFIDHVGIEEI